MTTINMHMKFEIEISKQTWLTYRKPCHLQSPETEKSNMAAICAVSKVANIFGYLFQGQISLKMADKICETLVALKL